MSRYIVNSPKIGDSGIKTQNVSAEKVINTNTFLSWHIGICWHYQSLYKVSVYFYVDTIVNQQTIVNVTVSMTMTGVNGCLEVIKVYGLKYV